MVSYVPRALALLAALSALLAPASVRADIYRWTDERGHTVISNIPPSDPKKARNLRLVAKENAPIGKTAAASRHVATRTEQALLDRIENLERQLQAQPVPPQAQAAPPPPAYAGYYPPPAPPPPAPAYYSDYYPSTYYPPTYYPPTYYYPPMYSYAVYPARVFVRRPAFVSGHRGFVRGGAAHRGRR